MTYFYSPKPLYLAYFSSCKLGNECEQFFAFCFFFLNVGNYISSLKTRSLFRCCYSAGSVKIDFSTQALL